MNCKLYQALSADLIWIGDKDRLKQVITDARAGLHNNRTKYIHKFSSEFWSRPEWYWRDGNEPWTSYRDRICAAVKGIGRAKSSFVIEMMYPEEARVICTDTHVIQAYNYLPSDISKVSDKEEELMEAVWVGMCELAKVPPVVARYLFWDKKQGQPDSRYWTRVFEQPKLLQAPEIT